MKTSNRPCQISFPSCLGLFPPAFPARCAGTRVLFSSEASYFLQPLLIKWSLWCNGGKWEGMLSVVKSKHQKPRASPPPCPASIPSQTRRFRPRGNTGLVAAVGQVLLAESALLPARFSLTSHRSLGKLSPLLGATTYRTDCPRPLQCALPQ